MYKAEGTNMNFSAWVIPEPYSSCNTLQTDKAELIHLIQG